MSFCDKDDAIEIGMGSGLEKVRCVTGRCVAVIGNFVAAKPPVSVAGMKPILDSVLLRGSTEIEQESGV